MIFFEPHKTRSYDISDIVTSGFIGFEKNPPRLLKVCSGLGLTGRNDYEIIQGNCSVKRQSKFYTRVLEMLGVAGDTPHDPDLTHDKNSVNLCNNNCSRLSRNP